MDSNTALNITTQSIHDLTIAVERIANALPERDRKSMLDGMHRIRQRRSSLLAISTR